MVDHDSGLAGARSRDTIKKQGDEGREPLRPAAPGGRRRRYEEMPAATLGLLLGVALLAVLCSAVPALAQQCTPTGTNQTCTNSIFLTGGAFGLADGGVPPGPGLTVTNTSVGTISGTTALAGGTGTGINAVTATVTDNGTSRAPAAPRASASALLPLLLP